MHKNQFDDHPLPAWASDMNANDFISCSPSYVGGKYYSLYEKQLFENETVGDITYYIYIPIMKELLDKIISQHHDTISKKSSSETPEVLISQNGSEMAPAASLLIIIMVLRWASIVS